MGWVAAPVLDRGGRQTGGLDINDWVSAVGRYGGRH